MARNVASRFAVLVATVVLAAMPAASRSNQRAQRNHRRRNLVEDGRAEGVMGAHPHRQLSRQQNRQNYSIHRLAPHGLVARSFAARSFDVIY